MWYAHDDLSLTLTYLNLESTLDDIFKAMPSPFAREPHAFAKQAAEILQSELLNDLHHLNHDFQKMGDGKMFGVLVVADKDGRVGFLRGVSGMLGKRWLVAGFVPPMFDVPARDLFWPEGQKQLALIEEKMRLLESGEKARELEYDAKALEQCQSAEMDMLKYRHAQRRSKRKEQRLKKAKDFGTMQENGPTESGLDPLGKESQSDRKERKTLIKEHKKAKLLLQDRRVKFEEERIRLKKYRTDTSNALLVQIQDGYEVVNAKGEIRKLSDIFVEREAPGGVGDCAAPKLLAYANRQGYRPLALAEFWWGLSPPGGARHHGFYYPSCKRKCGPLLPFLLEGIEVEAPPVFATNANAKSEPICLYEDDDFVVVNKPAEMLSVPGRGELRQDSVLTRLQKRYPDSEGPFLVHRLDLDTSGLLLLTKSLSLFKAMQKMFAERKIEKRYLAWVQGEIEKDKGMVRLALRVDLDDRPRQIFDPVHGKDAITVWRVLERKEGYTKLEMMPRSGRTHQLRLHAALAEGLAAPIVGDGLYGQPGQRLLLHAQSLRFKHPLSGQKMRFISPEPSDFLLPNF